MEVGHDGSGMVSLQKVWITSEQKERPTMLFLRRCQNDVCSWAVAYHIHSICF